MIPPRMDFGVAIASVFGVLWTRRGICALLRWRQPVFPGAAKTWQCERAAMAGFVLTGLRKWRGELRSRMRPDGLIGEMHD
jgi:hypothetical protein